MKEKNLMRVAIVLLSVEIALNIVTIIMDMVK